MKKSQCVVRGLCFADACIHLSDQYQILQHDMPLASNKKKSAPANYFLDKIADNVDFFSDQSKYMTN